MTGEASASGRVVCAALLGVVTLGLHPAIAGAGGLRDGLFKRSPGVGRQQAPPPIARYISEDGRSFILDRTQTRPLLKFDDSAEVWVLISQPAPRGDVIYKNDMGEPMLRATRLGGVTLFTDDRPNGQAVSLAGPASPVRMMMLSVQALGERLLHATVRSGRSARHSIVFQAEASPESAGLMGDAAIVVSVAFARLADRADGRAALAPIGKVQLVEGKRPAAAIRNGILWITVAPSQGMAGRPSSDRIMKLLMKGA